MRGLVRLIRLPNSAMIGLDGKIDTLPRVVTYGAEDVTLCLSAICASFFCYFRSYFKLNNLELLVAAANLFCRKGAKVAAEVHPSLLGFICGVREDAGIVLLTCLTILELANVHIALGLGEIQQTPTLLDSWLICHSGIQASIIPVCAAIQH